MRGLRRRITALVAIKPFTMPPFAKGLFAMALSLPIAGCAMKPLQGYAGPELPLEQVSFVGGMGDSTDEKLRELSVDGFSFLGRDVTLLPGKHRFQLVGGAGSPPRNCFDTDETDTYGFNSCMNERREQIRTSAAYVRDCAPDDFVKEKQKCQRDYKDYSCELVLQLEAGVRYKLGFYQSQGEGKFYCDYDKGEDIGEARQNAANGECRALGERTVIEEFDGHFY